MSEVQRQNCLIVCTDDRYNDLKDVLYPSFKVFRRSRIAGGWVDFEWADDAWNPSTLPQCFRLLFFHIGQGDEDVVPADRIFEQEFAFSSGGTGPADLKRDRTIPVQRKFRRGDCPIKPRHLAELEAFLRGERRDPPGFCRHDETVPSLWALAIACKTYAVAGIANGVIPRNHALVSSLGWMGQEWELVSKRGGRLVDIWPQVQKREWWASHLGFGNVDGDAVDSVKFQRFLARLIVDLELEVLAQTKLGERTDLPDRKAEDLLRFVSETSGAKTEGVIKLLGADLITPDVVARAYKDVSSLLEQR